MAIDFYTDVLGDLFIYDIQVNFILKQSTLSFGVHPEANLKPTHELKFTNVVWQEFSRFGDYNILFDIEVSESFKYFSERERNYLDKMRHYLPSDLFKDIEKNPSLQYYFIRSTTGLDGFVICKEAAVNTIS